MVCRATDRGSQTMVIRALRDAGAGILVGTDTDNAYVVPGHSVHEELSLLAAAGLTPFEGITAGTRDAATALGLADQIGTIAVGKRADLVLVEGDPLADIARSHEIAGAMADGRWLTRRPRRAAGGAQGTGQLSAWLRRLRPGSKGPRDNCHPALGRISRPV